MSYSKHVPVIRDNATYHYWIDVVGESTFITCLRNSDLIYENVIPTVLLKGLPVEVTT